jgi:uncharacterized protein (TIGR02001 family)
VLRVVGVLGALLVAGNACAQASGSIAVVSDYRYRGGSLSDGDPSAQLTLAWDQPGGGWYGGAQLARVRFGYPGAPGEGLLQSWAGYVHRLRSGLAVEAGAQYSAFSTTPHYDYPELYVGLGADRLRGRLSYTSRYFGRGAAWYAELDGHRPLRGPLRVFAHAGVLRVADNAEYRPVRRWEADAALGLGWDFKVLDLQLGWTGSNVGDDYCTPWQCGAGSGWVLRLARSW